MLGKESSVLQIQNSKYGSDKGFSVLETVIVTSLILNNFLLEFSTVYEDQLAKHLKKCNSREKPKPVSV